MFAYHITYEGNEDFFYDNHHLVPSFMKVDRNKCVKCIIKYTSIKIELYIISKIELNYSNKYIVEEMKLRECENFIHRILCKYRKDYSYHYFSETGHESGCRFEENVSYQRELIRNNEMRRKGICQCCTEKVEYIGSIYCCRCDADLDDRDIYC